MSYGVTDSLAAIRPIARSVAHRAQAALAFQIAFARGLDLHGVDRHLAPDPGRAHLTPALAQASARASISGEVIG